MCGHMSQSSRNLYIKGSDYLEALSDRIEKSINVDSSEANVNSSEIRISDEKTFIYCWLVGIVCCKIATTTFMPNDTIKVIFYVSVFGEKISCSLGGDYVSRCVTSISELHTALQRLDKTSGFSVTRTNKMDYLITWNN